MQTTDGDKSSGTIEGVLLMNDPIREKLFLQVDAVYGEFSRRLLPGKENILGVRLPVLRQMAKEIAKGNWQEFLHHARDDYFEEVMLQGMVIGYVKGELEELLPFVAEFIPKIDNWSVCDSFCAGLKITKKYRDEMWDFIEPYFQLRKAFEVRFAVVMALSYYVDQEYAGKVFQQLDSIRHENYYVKMAVAWAVSTYYTKLPKETMAYLKNNSLDSSTYNKAIQKIVESSTTTQEEKAAIQKMKRT